MNNSHLEQVNAITTQSGKNVDIPMVTQEPKEVNTSNNDIDLPNADEIVKGPVAIPFPQALKASRKLDSSHVILENLRQVKMNLSIVTCH